MQPSNKISNIIAHARPYHFLNFTKVHNRLFIVMAHNEHTDVETVRINNVHLTAFREDSTSQMPRETRETNFE